MIAPLTLALLLAGTDQAALHAAAASACAAFPLRSTGKIHYFCDCQEGAEAGCAGHAGDDARASATSSLDCTDSAAPCRTFAQANVTFNRMPGGDTIAFCQGGSFAQAGNTSWNNARCAAAADMRAAANGTTCDVRDYAPPWGGTHKPILRQTTADADLFRVWDGWTRGVRVLNLDLEGGGTGCGGSRVGRAAFEASTLSDVLVCNDTINGWFLALNLEASSSPHQSGWDIRGNTIALSAQDAFLGAGNHITIDANVFQDNGTCTATTHVIYPSGSNDSQIEDVDFRITNNTIRFVDRPCISSMINGHGTYDGFLIENNVLLGGSGTCYGMGVVSDGGYDHAVQYVKHFVARRNWIESGGWALLFCNSCPGAIAESNVLVSRGAGAQSRLLAIPASRARTSPADPITTGAVVRNNTIYVTGTSGRGDWVRAIAVPDDIDEGTGYVVANNSVYFGTGTGYCFTTSSSADHYAYFGNNACFGANALWNTTFDQPPRITADPGFASPGSDFSLLAASPLRGAGSMDQGAVRDFLDGARPSPPSIGAYDTGGGSGSGGPADGGGGSRAGCGTSGELPGALAGLLLFALVLRRRRSQP